MTDPHMIEYDDAGPDVRAVYDDIMAYRKTDRVTPYWKTIANHPPTLRRVWHQFKETMSPGALDAATKEMIYLAVSITNRCDYCIEAHKRAAIGFGVTPEMLGELLAVVSLANGANQLAVAYQLKPIGPDVAIQNK